MLHTKGKPVFADNMMFAGTNEDCVVVDTPSLSQACKVLLNNLNELNRISIHRMTFGTKGFSTRIEKGIQLFIEPYYFWTIDEVREKKLNVILSSDITCSAAVQAMKWFACWGTVIFCRRRFLRPGLIIRLPDGLNRSRSLCRPSSTSIWT